jgi:hypothetical protein
MILVLFLIISIYGSDFSSIVRFPEFMILKKIDILGYFNNLENVLVTEWMVNIFICAFICCRVIKDICPNLFFYLIIGGLFIVSILFFKGSYFNILYIKKYFYYIGFGLVIMSLIIKKSKI